MSRNDKAVTQNQDKSNKTGNPCDGEYPTQRTKNIGK